MNDPRSGRLLRHAAVAIGPLVLAFAARAGAQTIASPTPLPAPTCDVSALPATPPRPYTLYPIRHDELWFAGGYLGDWNHGHDPSGGLSGEYVRAFTDDQRLRAGLGMTFQFGSEVRGSTVAVIPALSFRGSMAMDDFFDFYALARAGVVLAGLGDSVRGGLGLGVRVGRLIELEATVDALAALGRPFPGDDRWAPAFSLSMGVDACAFAGCAPAAPPQTLRNFTCDLYDRAYDLCTSLDRAENEDVCRAVSSAMDPDRFAPTGDADSTEAFLEGLAASVTAPPLSSAIRARLLIPHRALRAQRQANQESERLLQQSSQLATQHCRYTPYPTELRTALGCDPPAMTCQRVVCRQEPDL